MSVVQPVLWASLIGGTAALWIERKQNVTSIERKQNVTSTEHKQNVTSTEHKQNVTSTEPVAWAYEGGGDWTSRSLAGGVGLGAYGHPGQMHAQAGQDWMVQSILQCPSHGYFVELASAQSEYLSNSLMLERDFQWGGLCIDANPNYLSKYNRRQCQFVLAAVGSPTDTVVTFDGTNEETGGIVGPTMDNKVATGATRAMKLVALADILRHFQAPKTIDFMSLDVEGAESIVMNGFPWAEIKFKVMTIERAKPDLEAALRANGYEKLRVNAHFGDATWINTQLMGTDIDRVRRTFRNGAPPYTATCMTQRGYARPSLGVLVAL